MIDPFGDYKWLPPRRLMELLRELPEDSRVVTNYNGNLTVYDSDGLYLGFIDFNLKGEIERMEVEE